MKQSFKILFIISILSSGVAFVSACKKDKAPSETDLELYEMSKTTAGFVWFKDTNLLLSKSSGSAHPQAYLRTRYNSIAASKLDSNGKIIAGSVFPQGSLIVKELYENSTTLSRYAILYKNAGSKDADANGWVWGYIDAGGSVAEPASKKGASCINCHSQSNNIDYMLMNKYFP